MVAGQHSLRSLGEAGRCKKTSWLLHTAWPHMKGCHGLDGSSTVSHCHSPVRTSQRVQQRGCEVVTICPIACSMTPQSAYTNCSFGICEQRATSTSCSSGIWSNRIAYCATMLPADAKTWPLTSQHVPFYKRGCRRGNAALQWPPAS